MIVRRSLVSFLALSAVRVSDCYSAPAMADDSLVYVAYLNEASAEVERPTGLVIHPHSLALAATSEFGWPRSASAVQAILSGVSASAAADAFARFQTTGPVFLPPGSIAPRLKVVQPLASDIAAVFKADDSLAHQWETFCNRFQGFTTLIEFSAVGYSSRFDEAVFIVSSSCGGLCGQGQIVLMRRTSGSWHIVKSEQLWVS